jgi:transglutaminase-like putative cysteine protease
VIYDIRQTTSYSYASTVSYSRHVLRLTPVDRPGQRVHASALDIEPVPVGRREGEDFFGNHMTWVALNAPHDHLVIKVAARITVEEAGEPDLFGASPFCRALAGAFFVCKPAGSA